MLGILGNITEKNPLHASDELLTSVTSERLWEPAEPAERWAVRHQGEPPHTRALRRHTGLGLALRHLPPELRAV